VNARRWLGVALVPALLTAACATGKSSRTGAEEPLVRKASVTDFYNEGTVWYVGVSVRASRLSGPQNMLPLNLFIANKKGGVSTLDRESFVLELPDGTRLPVVSYDQFKDEYQRDRVDYRAGEEFVERHTGRFSEPPFTWRPLDFFPLRNSPTIPRDEVPIREREAVHGFIYFAAPSSDFRFPEGKYRLLVTPRPGDVTLVVEMFPF